MSNPSKEQLDQIARQAEADLNSYEAKVGHDAGRGASNWDAGVDTRAEKKFPGAEVRYGADITKEASRDLGTDPETDAADRAAQHGRSKGGSRAIDEGERARQPVDILDQGQAASRNNVGSNPPGPGGSHFKGSDYYTPEDVPGSVATENLEPPASVVQASREAEGYGYDQRK